MKRFRLSPEAAANIREIWEFIAEDNVSAAGRIRQELYDAIRGLAKMPAKGILGKTYPISLYGFGQYARTSLFTDPIPSLWRSSPLFMEREICLRFCERSKYYFRVTSKLLDEGSDRVQLTSIGKSTKGPDVIMAVISSAEKLRKHDDYKNTRRKLAKP